MQQTGKAKPQFVLRIKIPKNYNQKAPNPFAIFINHSFFILTHNQKKKKKSQNQVIIQMKTTVISIKRGKKKSPNQSKI